MSGLEKEWERVLTSDKQRNKQILKIKLWNGSNKHTFPTPEMSLDKSEESRSGQDKKKKIKIDGVKAQENTGKGEAEIIVQAIHVSIPTKYTPVHYDLWTKSSSTTIL